MWPVSKCLLESAVLSKAVVKHRVYCRGCRFRLEVEAAPGDDWRVEAQCPSCDFWAFFTAIDTQDLARPDPAKLFAETQLLGAQLWQPINEHRDHPAVAWIDRVGNGMFEDDCSEICWPVLHWIYRFTRAGSGAYIWQEGGSWYVRNWHPLQGESDAPNPAEVCSIEAALDRLVDEGRTG
jgi:hypothetical protein